MAFGDTSWFDPYVYAGLGYSYLDGDEKLRGMTLNFGFGMNFWTGENFGINYQSGMKTGLGDNIENHFQHSIGVVFRFGGSSDDQHDEQSFHASHLVLGVLEYVHVFSQFLLLK